ncbi:30S ribosomal protein S4 [Patescibacteria group bacterium]|nr:30S ribosomal protein S4 [Patescibacteria group bacterium]
MARMLVDAKCRLCRASGEKLYLKGARCLSPKCPMEKKATPPGMHGPKGSKKTTDFGVQLRAKQKAKRIYGILEKQFKNYYLKAKTMKGKVGDNLLSLLERRLDNTVYALGLGLSRSHSRQLVLHKSVLVNGKVVNIPSYQVKVGDVITLGSKAQTDNNLSRFRDKDYKSPLWLEVDKTRISGKITAFPSRDDVTNEINENLIIEYYSR